MMAEDSPWPEELQRVGHISAKVEALASTIMHLKEQTVKCDLRRQKNVEALAQIRRMKKNNISPETLWTCGGPFFMELPISQAEDIILDDQKKLGQTIDNLRKEQKKNISELQKLSPSQHIDAETLKMLLKE